MIRRTIAVVKLDSARSRAGIAFAAAAGRAPLRRHCDSPMTPKIPNRDRRPSRRRRCRSQAARTFCPTSPGTTPRAIRGSHQMASSVSSAGLRSCYSCRSGRPQSTRHPPARDRRAAVLLPCFATAGLRSQSWQVTGVRARAVDGPLSRYVAAHSNGVYRRLGGAAAGRLRRSLRCPGTQKATPAYRPPRNAHARRAARARTRSHAARTTESSRYPRSAAIGRWRIWTRCANRGVLRCRRGPLR